MHWCRRTVSRPSISNRRRRRRNRRRRRCRAADRGRRHDHALRMRACNPRSDRRRRHYHRHASLHPCLHPVRCKDCWMCTTTWRLQHSRSCCRPLCQRGNVERQNCRRCCCYQHRCSLQRYRTIGLGEGHCAPSPRYQHPFRRQDDKNSPMMLVCAAGEAADDSSEHRWNATQRKTVMTRAKTQSRDSRTRIPEEAGAAAAAARVRSNDTAAIAPVPLHARCDGRRRCWRTRCCRRRCRPACGLMQPSAARG